MGDAVDHHSFRAEGKFSDFIFSLVDRIDIGENLQYGVDGAQGSLLGGVVVAGDDDGGKVSLG